MLFNMNGEVNGTMKEPVEISPVKDDKRQENKSAHNTSCNKINRSAQSKGVSDDYEIMDKQSGKTVKNEPDDGFTHNSDKNTSGVINANIKQEVNTNGKCNSATISATDKPNELHGDQKFVEDTDTNENRDTNENTDTKYASSKSADNDNKDSEDEVNNAINLHNDSSDLNEVEDTVSIHSDSDDVMSVSQGSDKNKDIKIIKNVEGKGQNGTSEIHEIDSDNDDCVVTEEIQKKQSSDTKEKNVELRRSSRTIKRKRYDDGYANDNGSDIEEIIMDDQIKRKPRPIVISDAKKLVEMAAKHSKLNPNQKKDHTVVIIDTNNKNKNLNNFGNKTASTTSSINASLYQSIIARGTTVTPVSSKTSTSTQVSQPPPSTLLPSLTDDMFVVEAPSFIVPYVYEKPSLKPFREFVDKLGKELEEQQAKEEKEILEKKKAEKERRQKERQERRERGEEVDDSEEEVVPPVDAAKKKKEKKARRRPQNDEDDESWDGSVSSSSGDDTISDEEMSSKIVTITSNADIKDLSGSTTNTSKTENYFDCSLGNFFMNIGYSLVQEHVQADMMKQQNKKLQREKKSGQCTKERQQSIMLLMQNLDLSKENNAPYAHPQKKCDICSFKTESSLVLAQHLETPHMKNNFYKCNFCPFQIPLIGKDRPRDILFHIEAEHNTVAKLERAPACHQCPNCPFEDNSKGKLARHLIACAKKFKPERNLAPPLEWEPPAKIPKIARARNDVLNPYSNSFGRNQLGQFSNASRPQVPINNMGLNPHCRNRMRPQMTMQPRGNLPGGPPIIRTGVIARHNVPILRNFSNAKGKSVQQPSISITPLPRQPAPLPVQCLPGQNAKGTFVICEICDGYIKDLEQLRNHMQWIHKVKIHPKMIYNRPPLNCQKCQFRFFTDQGLERHLLGSHGLVTSSMQEAANKGKDAGRCPVCGRVYQWKLLNHVARDHNLTLKPAHLSYKCTVCTATFGMYKQFENHVYSAHSVVAKKVMDKNKNTPAKGSDAHKTGKHAETAHAAAAAPPAAAKDK